jgi:aminopeptidase N
VPSLRLDDARARFELLTITSYDVTLDLRGEETFPSRTVIDLVSRGGETFLDLKARELSSIALDGAPLPVDAWADGRYPLTLPSGEHRLEVDAVMGFRNDGEGLHRAVDPADDRAYVYQMSFMSAAPSVFACFDQPDLKAPYTLHVTAPPDWLVVANATGSEVEPGRWEFETTEPLSTYFVTLVGGPYHRISDQHDGIPLGLHARASLREPLERHAAELFDVTKRSFDYFHGLFGIRYPFGDYHQVFVPEFNAGAMENPGCVTFRDQYLYRGAATRDELLTRANTVSHEMSHMWFGDIVTMKWWDDLWLNESFAEYMSHRCLVDATDYTDAWVDSSIVRKVWGYGAERSPSTHPVAGVEALDAQSALQNFDGISYAKGAATLRQLIAYVGDDQFIAGVRAYLSDKSYGNGTLADFLAAIETASGKDLEAWSRAWLLTADRDTISVDIEEQGGVIESAVVRRESPADRPADRPHAFDVAGWTDGRELGRVSTTITGPETALAGLEGTPEPAVLVPNASDLTWARVRLSDSTVAALPTQLAQIPDAQARAVVWSSLIDGVHGATASPEAFLDVFDAAWPHETNSSILTRVAAYAEHRVVPYFVPRDKQDAAVGRLNRAGVGLLERADTGTTESLAAARLVAGTSDDETLLRAWADGKGLPAGLEDDGDFRWIVVRNLASRGLIGAAQVDAFRAKDDTLQGGLNALMCRASLPEADAKAWAWEQLTTRQGRSNYEMVHLARGFWVAPDDALVEDYVPRYFTDVPAMSDWVGEDALSRVVLVAFPRVFTDETARLSAETIARDDLTPAVHRSLVDADAELREALASRATFGATV